MFTINKISLLFVLVLGLCYERSTANPLCTPDTVDFATKVDQSSIVVYGKTMAKMMNEESDAVFHVFFQVDCILKGPATLRQINITNAGKIDVFFSLLIFGFRSTFFFEGQVEGKKYCQEFPVGRGYAIAFLEPNPMNSSDQKTFVPADFVEIVDDGNNVQNLLARTCSLHRLVPLHSSALVTEICPAVATDPQCQLNATQSNSNDFTTTTTSTSNVNQSSHDGHLSKPIPSPQQEIEAIRGKSGAVQVNVDQPNSSPSFTFNLVALLLATFSIRLI